MALKKSELYSSLWAMCDGLRGGMDASQYKDYVLVLLFIKYISDKYANVPYAPISIPKGASFADMVALNPALKETAPQKSCFNILGWCFRSVRRGHRRESRNS
jgi:type I restriction-modification system DNA methylase subunit